MTQPHNSHVDSAGSAAATAWDRQWQQVPESWRTLHYRIDAAPFDAVFVRNQRYLNNPDGHDFTPPVSQNAFAKKWRGGCGCAVTKESARSSRSC